MSDKYVEPDANQTVQIKLLRLNELTIHQAKLEHEINELKFTISELRKINHKYKKELKKLGVEYE